MPDALPRPTACPLCDDDGLLSNRHSASELPQEPCTCPLGQRLDARLSNDTRSEWGDWPCLRCGSFEGLPFEEGCTMPACRE
jgi:hypothetical protein